MPSTPAPRDPVPRPLRRRSLLAAGAALPAALAACSGSGTATGGGSGATASGEPVRGGTVRVALSSDTSVINPHLTGSSVAATIARDVVDSLLAQDSDGTLHPWLASGWTSDGNTLYTFTLRDGVTFSDGEVLDAQAVKTTFDFVLDPANGSNYARSLLGPVAEVAAPDARTVTVRYDTPFAPLLQGLTLPYLGIQSPAFLASGDDLASRVVGSGPFVLDSYAPGRGSTLTRRDDHTWGPAHLPTTGAAYLDAVEYSYLPEAATRLGALQSGQVDAIEGIPPANAEAARKLPGTVVEVRDNPGVNYAFQLNTTRAPFDDVRVRQAFRSAVDVDAAVRATFFGTVDPATGILAEDTLTHVEPAAWKHEPDRAADLLDEAGWTQRDGDGFRVKDGKRLSVAWTYDEASSGQTNVNLVQALQSEYRAAGIDLVLDSVDSGSYASRTASGDYDTVSYFYVRAEPDILRTVYGSAGVGTGNASRVTSLDPLLDEAVGAADDRRAELYAQVQREVVDQAYSVPLYVANYQFAHTEDLQGVRWATNAKPLLSTAWLAKG